MAYKIQPMTLNDYDSTIALWTTTEGVGLSAADSKENIARYLARNPDLSFVAFEVKQLVGAVLCGHDGRRGYIHHLAVEKTHRHQGIGKVLVTRCLAALKAAGIDKCHLWVFTANPDAIAFWKEIGWSLRTDLVMMSHYTYVISDELDEL
jgi:ribosomal protein S18 acetylase RimI-like enzyme